MMLSDLPSSIRPESRCDESIGEGSGTNTTVASSPGVETSSNTQTYPSNSEFTTNGSFTKRHAYYNLQPMYAFDNPDISPSYKSFSLGRSLPGSSSPPALSSSPPICEPPPLPCSLANSCFPSPPPDYQLTAAASAAAVLLPTSSSSLGITNTVTTFPSPGSAFTELQPRASSNARLMMASRQLITPLTAPAQASDHRSNSSKSAFHEPVSLSGSTNVTAFTPPATAASYAASRTGGTCRKGYSSSGSSTSSSSPPINGMTLPCCAACGQMHLPNAAHRYNYPQPVVDDLCCTLCRLPLVDPLETKCGHTFCTPCLNNHLVVQALCPVDRRIINYLECQQASNIVKRLLDKLPVTCPNNRYCDTVLHRGGLEDHLCNWCSGTILPCENSSRGCPFLAPRVEHRIHASKCPFRLNGPGTVGDRLVVCTSAGLQPVGSARFDPRVAQEHWLTSSPSSRLTVSRRPNRGFPCQTRKKVDLQHTEEDFLDDDCPTIEVGSPTSIVIRRCSGECTDLGFTFVGGSDTPLPCILIQEIYLDGAVAIDGRLRPGDQILEVNGKLVTLATHSEARRCFTSAATYVQLTVFRESVNNPQQTPPVSCGGQASDSLADYEEEIFDVKLCKRQGKVLGIKLVGKKHVPGLYVLELVSGCEADLDGRLRKDDQILEINGVDLSEGTQEQAASIINQSADFVTFKVSRRNRSDLPDILRTTDGSEDRFSATGSRKSVTSGSSASESPVIATALPPNSSEPLAAPTSGRSPNGNMLSSHNQSRDQQPDTPGDQAVSPGGATAVTTEPGNYSNEGTLEPTCQEQIVVVTKAPNEPLGVSVAGGRQSQRGDTPIYVTNVSGESLLGRNRLVKRGDVLLEVNGIGLVGLTHNEAVDVLRRASHLKSQVQLRLIGSPETTAGDSVAANFMPSWTYWLQLPPICQLARIIRLVRSASSGTFEPLGFTIVGGLRNNTSSTNSSKSSNTSGSDREKTLGYSRLCSCPIVIKSIVPGLLAHRDARLKCGDLILAVNNISMLNVPHSVAVRLLKQLRSEVTLQVISWPGTIV